MSKPYVFHDVEFNNLNDLGEAYSKYFSSALEDIKAKAKPLIKFVRSKDKKIGKEVASILTSCKYLNNALTFIIFQLCTDKRVVINGETLTFKEFIQKLKEYGKKHKAIYAFMEDLGISKTYATLNIEPFLAKDSYFIEKSIEDPFTYEYLTTYYEFDYVESLQSFISNVFIYDDERFRRGTKVLKNDRFNMILAHKVGFKEVNAMRKEAMPLFFAVKLLTVEFNPDDLKKLVSDTFFWWLLDNFNKYKYKKSAKQIYKRLKNLKKEKLKLDKKYEFNAYVDLSQELYNTYLLFVEETKRANIEVKNKFNIEEFTLDKLYCKTYICTDYMKNNTVKLPKENIEQEDSNKEEIKEEIEEDDVSFDGVSNELSSKVLNKRVKQMYKMKRFVIFSFLFIAFYSILIITIKILEIVFKDNESIPIPSVTIELPYFIIAMLLMVLGFGIGIAILCRVNKSLNSLDNLLFLSNSNNIEVLSLSQEKQIQYIKANENTLKEKALRNHRILSCLLSIILGFISACFGICLLCVLNKLISLPIKFEEAYINNNLKAIFFIGGPIIGIAYGLLRKRKGALTAICMVILSLISVIVFSVIM